MMGSWKRGGETVDEKVIIEREEKLSRKNNHNQEKRPKTPKWGSCVWKERELNQKVIQGWRVKNCQTNNNKVS